MIGLGGLSYHTMTKLIATEDWVSHTHEVMTELESVLAALTEEETEQRGYLLTGSPKFLADRQTATQQVAAHLRRLREITADNPAQQRNLDQLEPLITQRLSLLDERIAVFRQYGLEASADATAMLKGKAVMDNIRELIAQMHSTENHLLAQRVQLSRDSARWSLSVIVVGSLLACGLCILASVIINRDFGLRRQAGEALRQSEERLRLMIESVKDYALIMLDPDGRVVSWNNGAQRIKGYTAEEIIGQHFSRFYPAPDVSSGLPGKALTTAAAEGRFEHEGWRVRKDGSQFWADVIITAVRDQGGRLLGFVKVTRDLTERKRAEEERNRFFNVSRDLMCIAGFDGFFKALNPAWEPTLGFSRQELQARPFIEFVHPDDRAATLFQSEKIAAGQETIHFENRYVCRDGSYRWLAWGARPVVPEQLIYATARDVTEQKRAEERIQRLNEELKRHAEQLETANKELEAFSYSVSHDLRAPLRHIDGFVKLLDKQAREKLDERSRRYLSIVADSARQMGVLIDDLLVFSRMSRTELRRSKVALNALVHEAVDALQMETSGRRITWKIGELPEVEADPAMLRQVWINLVANAVKYTRPRNPAEIEVGCAAANGEFVFFVRDNGVGFDMQYEHKLFGVFQRLHRAEEFEGTGIGLANVRRIISRHGGRTWAEGKPDGGATFYFSLPKTTNELKG